VESANPLGHLGEASVGRVPHSVLEKGSHPVGHAGRRQCLGLVHGSGGDSGAVVEVAVEHVVK
jgi:hypothetical protein